jgi:hypothetical protein
VVAGIADLVPSLGFGREMKGFDGVDAEGFDDRSEFDRHERIIRTRSSNPPHHP